MTAPLRGFRGPEACHHAGITYRQLDYWARTGLVVPSVRPAHGSGTQRLYSRDDVIALALVKALLDVGASLQLVRRALPEVRGHSTVALRGKDDVVTLTLDIAKVAARIPEPDPEPVPQQTPPEPVLHLVP